MKDSYDLIIIGSGPGGYVAAIKAAKLGKRIAIIEKREIGGTCLNRGCIPTKTLMHSTHFISEAKRMEQAGISFTDLNLDYDKLMERKDDVVAKIRNGIEGLFKANGITVYHGSATIRSQNTVRVASQNEETSQDDVIDLEAKNILIATGSVPVVPSIEGSHLENVITSDDLLDGEGRLYKKLLIIGGGVIGIEMATIYKELGCEVEIIEAMDRILSTMDKEISQSISMGLKRKGIAIHTGAKVVKISEGGSFGLICEYIEKDNLKTSQAEAVLLSVGRRSNTEGLFGQDMAIEMDGVSIKVNENFETSIPGIYAIGDVIRGKQLAHAASAQGIVAVERICGHSPSIDLDVIPSCIYTMPEVATVGIDEAEAKALGYEVKIGKYPMLGNSKTLLSMGERGFVKLICDAESGLLLGAQLLCDRATDLVGELALAISKKLTYKDLGSIIRPHPTYEEAITEAAEDISGMAIHIMPRRSL
ncbi:MAG: dihydrolipoyl dehydrogenase [Anaerolineaceae bacterium]|nr:MAG: dihydrolipoyl dehydrogenase [Anaerolineaceae bacterium]